MIVTPGAPLKWRGHDSRMIDLPVDQMIELYRDGASLTELAHVMGCGTTTVWRRLRAAGVTLRKQGVKG